MINELDEVPLRRVLESGQGTEITNAYHQLPDNQQRFLDLLDDSEVAPSLIRVVGEPEINVQNIRTAIVRTKRLDDRGHDVINLKTAREANRRHDGQPPHKEGTVVVEYEIQSPGDFVRVYDNSGGPAGRWLMKKSEFEGLESREGVLNRFGLSKEWKDYNSIAEITLGRDSSTMGIQVQMSTAGEITDRAAGVTREGGGTKHYVTDARLDGWKNRRPLEEFLENYMTDARLAGWKNQRLIK